MGINQKTQLLKENPNNNKLQTKENWHWETNEICTCKWTVQESNIKQKQKRHALNYKATSNSNRQKMNKKNKKQKQSTYISIIIKHVLFGMASTFS